MSLTPKHPIKMSFQTNMLEAAIRIGLVALLIVWCFSILRPFLDLIIWGVILAVAFNPMMLRLAKTFNLNRSIAATLFILIILALLLTPIVGMVMGSVEHVQDLATRLQEGTLMLPPPNDNVAGWPIIGEKLHALWSASFSNLEDVLQAYSDQLETFSKWLLTMAGASALGILKVTFSLIIAGAFMAKADACYRGVSALMSRLLGNRGEPMVNVATATIRSVANGVVGVAAIQSILAGISFMVMGIPLAGLWAFVTLVVAIIQLPTAIVFLPIIAWSFSTYETVPAVLFTIWILLVGVSDSVLKPILLGRGVSVPMLVILLGALGGMVVSGIVGLFVGAVVLALAWELFLLWLNNTTPETEPVEDSRVEK